MTPKILIVKLSSMGDVIHTFPAAWRLRQAFPDATLGWVVERAHGELLAGLPWLDKRIVWEQRRPGSLWTLRRALRQTRWDLAVDFQGLARSAVIARLSGARRILGFRPARELAHWLYTDAVPALPAGHAVERSLRLAAEATRGFEQRREGELRFRLPATSTNERPTDRAGRSPAGANVETLWDLPFQPRASDEACAMAWLAEQGVDAARDRLVAIFPDCRNPTNRWPLAKFCELGRLLLEEPTVKVVLAGAPAAAPLCAAIHDALGSRALRADGRFGLLGTAALLTKVSAIVAGDTGPGHLAVALGLGGRLVSLFGPTDPARTGPYSRRTIVLSQGLSCSPCLAKRACPLGHATPPCMSELEVARVHAAVCQRLHAHGPGGGTVQAA